MKYHEKLKELMDFKALKEKEYKNALRMFTKHGRALISFEEVSNLKEELDEIGILITALKRVFDKV